MPAIQWRPEVNALREIDALDTVAAPTVRIRILGEGQP